MFKNANYLFRTVVYAAIVGLVAYSAWQLRRGVRGFFAAKEQRIEQLVQEVAAKDNRIAALADENRAKSRQIDQLQAAVRLLKVDHRVARIEVVEQGPAPDDATKVQTTLRFVEAGPEGEPIGDARTITLLGKVAYVDALVIKFEDSYVEQGDRLRGTSVCLFRRLFGEYQQPSDGHALDAVGGRPAAYSPGDPASDFERELWAKFWDYANDPKKAATAGVRAVHGEAPFIELRPGMTYRVELRASGGLSIRPGAD